MNKSLEYIQKRIREDKNLSIEEYEGDRIQIIPALQMLTSVKDYLGKPLIYNYDKKEPFSIKATFNLADENTEFMYYTSNFSQHDGTLAFVTFGCIEMINKVFSLGSVYKDYQNMVAEDFTNKKIIFYIGDFIVNLQIDANRAPEDKPWMMERQEILLPLRMEITDKENN